MKLQTNPKRELTKQLPKINDRIEYVRCILGYDVKGFARKIGSSPAALLNVVSKDSNVEPTMKMVTSMITLLPVSKEWLFMGTGEPFTVKDVKPFFPERTGGATLDENVPLRVKQIRMEAGLNQTFFAAKLGMSRDSYGFMETNKVDLQLYALKKLVIEFNVSCQWVLFGIGDRYTKKKL